MTRTTLSSALCLALVVVASSASGQWKSQDIGNTVPGTTNIAGGTITIQGNGADISGTADAFRFVYRLADGDCEIVARVVSQENTNQWAKAGVMIRESLDPGSRHAHINRNPDITHGIEFQYRNVTSGNTSGNYSPNVNALPRWLRVQRRGSAFSGYYAPDNGGQPGAWTQQGITVPMNFGNPVYIGMSCLSHVQGTLGTVVFDNVQTTGTRTVGAGIILGKLQPPPTRAQPTRLPHLLASLTLPGRAMVRPEAVCRSFAVLFPNRWR